MKSFWASPNGVNCIGRKFWRARCAGCSPIRAPLVWLRTSLRNGSTCGTWSPSRQIFASSPISTTTSATPFDVKRNCTSRRSFGKTARSWTSLRPTTRSSTSDSLNTTAFPTSTAVASAAWPSIPKAGAADCSGRAVCSPSPPTPRARRRSFAAIGSWVTCSELPRPRRRPTFLI